MSRTPRAGGHGGGLTVLEMSNLRRVFDSLDKKRDGVIDPDELAETYAKLKHNLKKNESQEIIWEVDEDCDSVVNWDEFQSMFFRCRADKTGLEPRRLFRLVEFMMQDSDGSGAITIEECLQSMYVRYGKERMDYAVKELFDEADIETNRILSFTEYCGILNKKNTRTLLAARSQHGAGSTRSSRDRGKSPPSRATR
eukprot:tig00000553_g2078.t1